MKSVRIKADGVSYRQGWLEIAQVRPGFINIETWTVNPEIDISFVDAHLNEISDESVTGNTELELSVHEARKFAAALLEAAEMAAKMSEG